MSNRRRIQKDTLVAVLTRSRRRCALCFGLSEDLLEKQGQIAHLDKDPSNSAEDNLAFLCLPHHDQYDSSTSQSKGFTKEEVKAYRARLYLALATGSNAFTQKRRAEVIADLWPLVKEAAKGAEVFNAFNFGRQYPDQPIIDQADQNYRNVYRLFDEKKLYFSRD